MVSKDELIALGVDEAVAREVVKKVASNKIELLKDYVAQAKFTKLQEDYNALDKKLKDAVGEDAETQLAEKDAEITKLRDELTLERKLVQVKAYLGEQKRKPIPEAMEDLLPHLSLEELELDEKGVISEKELKKRYEDVLKTKSFYFQPEGEQGAKPKFTGSDPAEGKEGDSGISDIDAFLSPILNR